MLFIDSYDKQCIDSSKNLYCIETQLVVYQDMQYINKGQSSAVASETGPGMAWITNYKVKWLPLLTVLA